MKGESVTQEVPEGKAKGRILDYSLSLAYFQPAIVLGARYYVTSDETLCRWINNGYPHLFRT